jgi:hypothetical protein
MLATIPGGAAMGRDRRRYTITFGKEEIISDFERERPADGRLWAPGYSQASLDAAQEKYGLAFPPDVIALFRDRRPVLGYDWRSDDAEIREMLKWPLDGGARRPAKHIKRIRFWSDLVERYG